MQELSIEQASKKMSKARISFSYIFNITYRIHLSEFQEMRQYL